MTDPYIDVGVDWLPIIIIMVVTACVLLFVVIPLLMFAVFKSYQRREEKVLRRVTLRNSMRSRSATAAAATPSVSRAGSEDVKRRRPPMSTTVLDISGVTLDESTLDYDKRKMPPPLDTTGWSSSSDVVKKRPPDWSSYDDSDLGPVHRSYAAAGGAYPPPKRPLENEIATVGGRSLYGPAPAYQPAAGGFFNEGYLGDMYPAGGQSADSFDDRSIDARFANVVQAAMQDGSNGVAGSSRGGRTSRPRPQLSTSGAASGTPKSTGYPGGAASTPKSGTRTGGSVDSPRRHADGGSTPTGAGSAASRTKRPRPKISEYSM